MENAREGMKREEKRWIDIVTGFMSFHLGLHIALRPFA